MGTDTVETFEDSLGKLDVDWTHTTRDALHGTLAALVERPAVGVALPYEGATLPDEVALDPSPADLETARTGVTPAAFAIADYGSVVLPSTEDGLEPVSLFPELHVPVIRASDIVPGMADAIERFAEDAHADRGSAIIATGPSATADMGELVRGAHGPKEVHVVILDE